MLQHNRVKPNNLSIIIPCFNEEKTIEKVVKDINLYSKKFIINCEIIIIDDGSIDETYSKLKKILKKYNHIKVIKHKNNKGFGSAYKTGIKNSSGEFCVLIPGDNEADINDTLRIFSETKNIDMLLPYTINKEVRNLQRRFLSKLFVILLNLIFNTNVKYFNGSVFYRTKVLKKVRIKSKGFLFQSEIVLKIIKSGYLYNETPYFLKHRSGGDAKALKFKNLLIVFTELVRLIIEIYFIKKYRIPIIKDSATFNRTKDHKNS